MRKKDNNIKHYRSYRPALRLIAATIATLGAKIVIISGSTVVISNLTTVSTITTSPINSSFSNNIENFLNNKTDMFVLDKKGLDLIPLQVFF